MIEKEIFPQEDELIEMFPPFGEDQREIDDDEQWERAIDYETFMRMEELLEEKRDKEIDGDRY